jgi:hypothetical protein
VTEVDRRWLRERRFAIPAHGCATFGDQPFQLIEEHVATGLGNIEQSNNLSM